MLISKLENVQTVEGVGVGTGVGERAPGTDEDVASWEGDSSRVGVGASVGDGVVSGVGVGSGVGEKVISVVCARVSGVGVTSDGMMFSASATVGSGRISSSAKTKGIMFWKNNIKDRKTETDFLSNFSDII